MRTKRKAFQNKRMQIKDRSPHVQWQSGDECATAFPIYALIAREANDISWPGAIRKNRGCFRDNMMERLPPHFLKEMRTARDF